MSKFKFIWLYIVAIIASLGGLLSGYDTGVISGALLFINETWDLSDSLQGIVVSSVLIGAVIGAATNGILADIFGRKKVIIATAIIFILGSILCGFAPNVYVLIISRIFVGLAVGIVNFVIPLYLSEISPKSVRGTLVSLYQWAITAGILFSYFINAAFAQAVFNWRWMLLAGVLPGLVLLIGMCFMSDTPRWLISKNRTEEAEKVLKKIEPDVDIKTEINDIKKTVKLNEKTSGQRFKFKKWMIMPFVVGIGIMFAQICTGINTIIVEYEGKSLTFEVEVISILKEPSEENNNLTKNENVEKENLATKILPYAGARTIFFIVVRMIIIVIISYILYRKYKI